jgi:hypothetical protein
LKDRRDSYRKAGRSLIPADETGDHEQDAINYLIADNKVNVTLEQGRRHCDPSAVHEKSKRPFRKMRNGLEAA